MDIETFRDYCLEKNGVTECFPFDDDTLVFKVIGKMFAATSLSARPFTVNLKMNPDMIPSYREEHEDIQPGYHMNKQHWNTVNFESGSMPNKTLMWLIDHSYDEVVKKLPKKTREELMR